MSEAPPLPNPPSASSTRLGRLPCLYGNCPTCPEYSHCYPCELADGTPYRMALRRDGRREIHDGDTDRLLELLSARQEPLSESLGIVDRLSHVPNGYAPEPGIEAAPAPVGPPAPPAPVAHKQLSLFA